MLAWQTGARRPLSPSASRFLPPNGNASPKSQLTVWSVRWLHRMYHKAVQRRTQPKYNTFSTAVYNPVTPYECTPASSHTSDGPKRTAAGAAGRINQSQGRFEGRKFRFQLLLCVYTVYSTIQRAAKPKG